MLCHDGCLEANVHSRQCAVCDEECCSDHAKAKAFSEYTKQDYTSILKAKEVKLNANVEAMIDFPECKTLEELTLMLAISGDLKK